MKLTRGQKVISFIERFCVVPEGMHVGKPICLEDFQKKWILAVYDNPHGTRRAYLSIGRKNGKSALIAALILAHIAGPEAAPNSQIVSGAQSRDQAALVFELAEKMINLSPELSARVRIIPSSKRLVGLSRNVEFRALSAEGKTAHGKSPVLAILDETGQIEGPQDDFVDAITTAQGAHAQPMLFVISTQASTDGALLSIWLDDAARSKDPKIVSHVYEAPKDCALTDKAAWAAANPALGKFRSLADVEEQAVQAVRMPSMENTFRNLILNQRVQRSSPFVSKSVWESNGSKAGSLEGKKVYAGLDLSSVQDLTALVLVSEDGDVESTFWLPEAGLVEKAAKDHVPYDVWKRQGHLQTTPGKAIEYAYIAKHLKAVFERCDVQSIAFDRYNMRFLMPWLEKEDFSARNLERFREFGQGTQSMTPALRELEAKLLNSWLKHGMHPVLTMCAANAVVEGDSGARKFTKFRDNRRIDGMVALAMAVGVMPTESKPARKFQVFMV